MKKILNIISFGLFGNKSASDVKEESIIADEPSVSERGIAIKENDTPIESVPHVEPSDEKILIYTGDEVDSISKAEIESVIDYIHLKKCLVKIACSSKVPPGELPSCYVLVEQFSYASKEGWTDQDVITFATEKVTKRMKG